MKKEDQTILLRDGVNRPDKQTQSIIRVVAIILLFWAGYFMLSIFFKAFLYKIPPPIRIFPQLYFALGYLFLGIGIYILIVMIRTKKHKVKGHG